MAAWVADILQDPLAELGVDTEFWSNREHLLHEFNDLSAQGVHSRFWPGRESGCQLEGDWELEMVKPKWRDALGEPAAGLGERGMGSFRRFVLLPMIVGGILSREGREEEALKWYEAALEHAPNPWVQSELGYVFLERAGVKSLPACAARLDKAEVIGQVGEPVVFADRFLMLKLALEAFGRAWGYSYTAESTLEDDPDPAFDLLTLDGLRVTFIELGHTLGVNKVCQFFWELVEYFREPYDWPELTESARSLNLLRSFGEPDMLLRRAADALPPETLQQYEEKCARRFGPYWDALPEMARRLVRENEYSIAVITDPTYKDWGGVTMNYCRAIESVLRERLGAKIDAEGGMLPDALRALLTTTRKGSVPFASLIFPEFTRLFEAIQRNQRAFSLFEAFVAKHARKQQAFYCSSQLADDLRELLEDFRNPSAHADPRKVVSKGDVLKLRGKLVPDLDDSHLGLLARFAIFGQQ